MAAAAAPAFSAIASANVNYCVDVENTVPFFTVYLFQGFFFVAEQIKENTGNYHK